MDGDNIQGAFSAYVMPGPGRLQARSLAHLWEKHLPTPPCALPCTHEWQRAACAFISTTMHILHGSGKPGEGKGDSASTAQQELAQLKASRGGVTA